VPHNTKRFPGYTRAKIEEVVNKRGKATGEVERMEARFEAGTLRDRIYGVHINNYMNQLKKDDASKFKRQFSKWEKAIAAAKVKTCEELYKKVHASVCSKPERVPAKGNANRPKLTTKVGDANRVYTNTKGGKWITSRKLTNNEKKAAVAAKFATLLA
jgi:large subunit ribosomal protein L5e